VGQTAMWQAVQDSQRPGNFLASFPGPAQLFIVMKSWVGHNEKLGGAWEQGLGSLVK